MSFFYSVAMDMLKDRPRVQHIDEFMGEKRYKIDREYVVTINEKEKKCRISNSYGIICNCNFMYRDGITPEEIIDRYYKGETKR